MVADELRRQADNFIELLDLEGQIARNQPHRDDRHHPVTVAPDADLA
jgi:uncharacterized LabA/DUF88 family protein